MNTSEIPSVIPNRSDKPPSLADTSVVSSELAAELNRLETAERTERYRRAQEELAKQRVLARFD